jgi:uncharacterized protein
MFLDRLVRVLLPRQGEFFELIKRIAAQLDRSADEFVKFADCPPGDYPAVAQEMRRLEHEGDELAHELYKRLDKTFVTPIDREDLAHLTSKLDDVLDTMEHAAAFIVLYRIPKLTEPMQRLVKIGRDAVRQVRGACDVLRSFGEPEKLKPYIVSVNELENQGDFVFRRALEDLFRDEHDGVELVRQRDILFALEEWIDSCEDVMDVVRSVVVKNG